MHRITLAVACAVVAASNALAQVDPAAKTPEAVAAEHVRYSPLRRSAELLDKVIKNNGGTEVGVIRDIVVDSRDGRLAFAVVEFTGVAELGKNYYLVPFAAIKEDTARQNLILNIDAARFEAKAGFDPKRWPDMSGPQFVAEVYERYGYEPYWLKSKKNELEQRERGEVQPRPQPGQQGSKARDAKEESPKESPSEVQPRADEPRIDDVKREDRPARDAAADKDAEPKQGDAGRKTTAVVEPQLSKDHPWLNRLSQMTGKAVIGPEGKSLGTLHDVVIDLDGRVAYGVIARGEGEARRLAAVPWSALTADGAKEQFTVAATPQVIESVSFSEKEWPNMHEVYWARKLHEQFGEAPYWDVYGTAGLDDDFWSNESEYNRGFAGRKRQQFAGKLVRVEELVPGRGAARGKVLVLLSDGDELYKIHLGPNDYLESQKGVDLKEGQMIRVTGVPGSYKGNPVVQAHMVQNETGQTLELRDEGGKVKWQRSAIRGDQNDPIDRRQRPIEDPPGKVKERDNKNNDKNEDRRDDRQR